MSVLPLPEQPGSGLSPRRRMLHWVRSNRQLDMLALRIKAREEFSDDSEMVEFALGQVAVWEAANLGHLTRKQSARELLAQANPSSRDSVAAFLAKFPQDVVGRYWEIARMTKPMLAESIERDEHEVFGRLAALGLKRAIYDLLPDDGRTTVASFFASSHERRSVLVDIIRTYEGEDV